jgi:hypothetical protein
MVTARNTFPSETHPDRFLDYYSLDVVVPDKVAVRELLAATETLIEQLEHHSQYQHQRGLDRGRIYYCWHLAKAARGHAKNLETYPDPPPFNLTHVTVSHFMALWVLIDKQPDTLRTKANDNAETVVPFGASVHKAAKDCYDLVKRWIVGEVNRGDV